MVPSDKGGYLREVKFTSSGAQWRYTYDFRNRLVKVERTTTGTWTTACEYRYDGLNRRVWVREGYELVLLYDGWQCVEERNWPGNVIRRQYAWGARYLDEICQLALDEDEDGVCVSVEDFVGYYVHNANWNVLGLTHREGSLAEYYLYDPYGRPTIKKRGLDWIWFTADDDTAASSTMGNPWLFQGQRYDATTTIYYFKNRYYSPQLGRFLQRDPAGYVDGAHLYQALLSGPAHYTDPSGTAVVVQGSELFAEKVKSAFEKLCPCFNGGADGKISRIIRVGNRIGFDKTWNGGNAPFDASDAAARNEFCCNCYMPDKGMEEKIKQAWKQALQNAHNQLARQKKLPRGSAGWTHQLLVKFIEEAAKAAGAVQGYRGCVAGCNLVWDAIANNKIIRYGPNRYHPDTGIADWDTKEPTGLAHEVGHALRNVKEGAGLYPDESGNIRQWDNPVRFERKEDLRTETHGGLPGGPGGRSIIGTWANVEDALTSLMATPKPKWCEGLSHTAGGGR